MTLFMFFCKHFHSISNLSEWPEGMITFIENHTEYNRLFGATTMLMCQPGENKFYIPGRHYRHQVGTQNNSFGGLSH